MGLTSIPVTAATKPAPTRPVRPTDQQFKEIQVVKSKTCECLAGLFGGPEECICW